jgi:uncharacterized membrane protein
MNVTPMNTFFVYLITVPIFFIIDLVWLGLIAKGFYQKHLGYLMRPQINWVAAILFYLLFIIGIVLFAVKPALEVQKPIWALVYGALFGFFAYATYDLTNLATVKDWPVIVTVIDLIWGTVLCGAVALGSYVISNKIL